MVVPQNGYILDLAMHKSVVDRGMEYLKAKGGNILPIFGGWFSEWLEP